MIVRLYEDERLYMNISPNQAWIGDLDKNYRDAVNVTPEQAAQMMKVFEQWELVQDWLYDGPNNQPFPLDVPNS